MKKTDQPKIVALGGGTGLSTMLRGLKNFTLDITAVVTVADDGGGSGMLRHDLGMLPPGDIRNCILALAEIEPLMSMLMQYRFSEGRLKGQCFGNLFLAAMNGISKNFEQAVKRVSDVLRVTGRVLPVTEDNVYIEALLENGEIIKGESNIGKSVLKVPIKRLRLIPGSAKPLPDVLDAIKNADIIVLGPGSLYTSIIPNLIVDGVSAAIEKSNALKIYVCNIMTQPGETDNYCALKHVEAIFEHAGRNIIDCCIVNKQKIPGHLLERYRADGADQVYINRDELAALGIKVMEGNFLRIEGEHLRHDYEKLAQTIIGMF